MINLFDDVPARADGEIFTEVLSREDVRIERIVSIGQFMPTDKPIGRGMTNGSYFSLGRRAFALRAKLSGLSVGAREGSPLLTAAGLWDEWKDRATGERLKSCTMIVTDPNDFTAEIHDRMPVFLTKHQHVCFLAKAGRPAPNRFEERQIRLSA